MDDRRDQTEVSGRDVGSEASEMRAQLRRTQEIDEAQSGSGDESGDDEREDAPPADTPATSERDGHGDGRDAGEDAAEVRAHRRESVDRDEEQQRDHAPP